METADSSTFTREELGREHFPRRDRVRAHTPAYVNARIDRAVQGGLIELERRGPQAIRRRLIELEQEWDIDRALMAAFATLAGAGVLAGATHSKRWLWLPGAQISFLMLHAIEGWCPPVSLFRRLGYRTQKEIDAEREALTKLLDRELDRDNATLGTEAA